MANRYKHKSGNKNNLKLWTILCLVLVCVAAIALRALVVYMIYPLDFKEEIKASSAEYSLDKYMVCAVIYTESHFNKNAVSGPGAVGLMQVMPDTGAWAAGKMGLEGFTAEKLSDPDVNIAIGCWYLKYLSDLFDGDMRKVLAGYNAGPSKVQNWVNSEGALGEIPYEETEQYLEKVLRYYEIYKGLYSDF
jgi:soluble lytic murein transglycosylase